MCIWRCPEDLRVPAPVATHSLMYIISPIKIEIKVSEKFLAFFSGFRIVFRFSKIFHPCNKFTTTVQSRFSDTFGLRKKLSLNCIISLNRMILCSKLKNNLCKIVTKSQVVTNLNVTKSRLHYIETFCSFIKVS